MSRTVSPNVSEPEGPVLFPGGNGRVFESMERGAAGSTMSVERAASRCRLAREIASAVLRVPVEEIARSNRSVVGTCQARHLAIYLAHVVFQVPLGTIAVHFGRDRTSVAHAVRRVEDGRDDEVFEELVGRLERLADACLDLSAGGART